MRRAAAAAWAAAARALPPHTRAVGGVPEGAIVFDRALKRAHRDRAAWMTRHDAEDDAFTTEIVARTVDRLLDCTRTFDHALVLGGATRATVAALAGLPGGGVKRVTVIDSSPAMLEKVSKAAREAGDGWPQLDLVCADEEEADLGVGRFDVAISALALHWVNDLPSLLTRARASLGPDGLFVASLLGGDATLRELRSAFAAAELAIASGLSSRVSPTVRPSDTGGLLQRAGFGLPGVDVDEVTVRYARGATAAIDHVRAMAGSNAVVKRARFLPRTVAADALARLKAESGGGDGSVASTFEILFLTGWAAPAGGERAAERGSATVSLADLEAALSSKREE